jgi:hypothetical protein
MASARAIGRARRLDRERREQAAGDQHEHVDQAGQAIEMILRQREAGGIGDARGGKGEQRRRRRRAAPSR